MARKPKGSIVHSIPSWNPLNLLGTGTGQVASTGNNPCVGLFNNATDGSWLVVWEYQAAISLPSTTPTDNIQQISFSYQADNGNTRVQFPGIPLVDTAAQLAGTVWGKYNQGNGGIVFYSPANPNYVYQWQHEWPFAYVRPGHSLVCAGDGASCGFLNVTYIWEVVAQI
jgi:hypothetical protein